MMTVNVNTEPSNPQIPTEPLSARFPLSQGDSTQHRLRPPGLAIMQDLVLKSFKIWFSLIHTVYKIA